MKTKHFIAAAIAALSCLPALAHISYTGRDFGNFTGLESASATIANQAIAGNYGWADAADADWGDSHKARWFKFTLANAAEVTITAAAKADATATSLGGLTPAFSLYQGVAPSAAYDTSAVSQAWRDALGFSTEGVWNALGNFKIGNDAGTLGELIYQGHSTGTTSGGQTSGTFRLAAGTYSIVVGGNVYDAQNLGVPGNTGNFGVSATLAVAAVPEPGSVALGCAGALAVLAMGRRRNQQAH